jgi:1A family penicillin-binding protein
MAAMRLKQDNTSAAATERAGGSRTAAAGRQFLSALGSDLAALGRRLRLRNTLAAGRRQTARSAQWGRNGHSLAGATCYVLRRFALGFLVLAVAGATAVALGMMWALHEMPLERKAIETGKPALLLEAANGEPLGRVGPLKVADSTRKGFPDHLVQAVLSVEDRRFYSHYGIDLWGIARATSRNLNAGEIVEGGSTITQQVVKMQFLGNDRTFARKLREAITAIWLEHRMSKDEILTRYLNTVYLGAGAHGMASAARLYFNKRPAELTLAEAAMLAGLIRAPSQYSPLRDLETAQARAAVVIDAMLENGAIDAQAAAEAKAKPATLNLAPEATQAGSWFADWVARDAPEVATSFGRSVRARTTLVPELQRLAERIINEALDREGAKVGASQAALVALRPDGAVVAMVGGRDYQKSNFNRAVEPNRHPGSAFKLFVYLAALREGYALHDVVDASPIEVKGWRPENFGGRQYGRMMLAEAFIRSINTAAVRLAMDVGLKNVIAAARDLGIDARLSAHPSLALGAVEVSLLDLTGAFASVRAGRMPVSPWAVSAFGAEGEPRLRAVGPPIGSGRPLDHQEPLVELLRLVVEHGTGRRAALDGFAAGKTGTSQNHRDAWFIGFNEALVVGVWVGNDDNSPMQRVVGGTLPTSIWQRFMTAATQLLARDGLQVASFSTDGSAQGSSGDAQHDAADAPRCDYHACASRYRSFRPSDCTYQPYSGPRRICDIGAEPSEALAQFSRATGDTRAQACNIDACSRHYRSFNPPDCTYQPYYGGPRRICER